MYAQHVNLLRLAASGVLAAAVAAWSVVIGAAPHRPAQARPAGWSVDRLDQVGGVVGALAVSGRTAYVGIGQRIEVFDVSAKAAPARVGQSGLLPAPAAAVALAGDDLMVAAGSVLVIDVADRTSPQIVWNVDAVRGARALAVTGARAYVLDADGLSVLDLANPARPALVGAWRGRADALAADGDIAFLAGTSGVRVIDATDPTRPVQAALLAEPAPWGPYALATSGGYLWVADTLELRVIDVRHPAQPRFVRRLDTPETYERSGEPVADVVIADGHLIHAGRADLRLYDISEPAAPALVGQLAVRANVVHVAAAGDVALLADRDAGLRTVDLTDRHVPQMAALVPSRSAAGVTLAPGRLFAFAGDQEAFGDNVWAIDVDERGALTTLGQVGLPTARDLAVIGRYVYAACGESGLEVLDFGNARQPFNLATYLPPGRAVRTLAASGNRLYIGDTFIGLTVVDASHPSSLYELGKVELPGAPAGLAAVGRYVFAAQGVVGMTVVDVADPASPRIAGRFNPDAGPDGVGRWDVRALAVDGATAWLVTSDGALVAVDVRDPRAPRQVAVLPLDGDPTDLVVLAPGRLVVTTNSFGFPPGLVRLYDVSDPTAPELLARLETPGVAGAVAGDGATIVVADGDAGVLALGVREVLEPTEPPTETPTETPEATATATGGPAATTPSSGGVRIYLPLAADRAPIGGQ